MNDLITLTLSTGWILDTNYDYSTIVTAEYFDENDTEVINTKVIVTFTRDNESHIKGFVLNNASEYSKWTNQTMFTEYVDNQNGQSDIYFNSAVGVAFNASEYTADDISILNPDVAYIDITLNDYVECGIYWTDIAKKYGSINFRFVLDGAIYGDKFNCKKSLSNCICSIVDGLPYLPENRVMYLRINQTNNAFFTSDDLQEIKQEAIDNMRGHHNQRIYIQGLGGEEDVRYWGIPVGDTN